MTETVYFRIVRDAQLSKGRDIRFVVVDAQNQVLDNARGYGYTSWRNALRGFAWKCRNQGVKMQRITPSSQ